MPRRRVTFALAISGVGEIHDGEARLRKIFIDGYPVIGFKARPGQDDWGCENIAFFDLYNCWDIFSARTLSDRMSNEAVERRFDEIWHSGELVTIDTFTDEADEEAGRQL